MATHIKNWHSRAMVVTWMGVAIILSVATSACAIPDEELESSSTWESIARTRVAFTPVPMSTNGKALIDELIACDGPNKWDRDMMVQRLTEDHEYVELLTQFLEVCHLANSPSAPTPHPTITPVPTISQRPTHSNPT